MLLKRIGAIATLLGSVLAGQQAIEHFRHAEDLKTSLFQKHKQLASRQSVESHSPHFLTNKTKKFAVNGTGLPEVNFDIGESYSGLLPISNDPNETRKLFFWFFPSTNPAANKELTLWFNGGPGCSSMIGLLRENGPILWQPGTLSPTRNSYSWTNLTNVVWIEQPVGVGYTQGTPNIRNEIELAQQFIGFWKNFVDTFDIRGYKLYLTGESCAGFYVPYIADAFIAAKDPNYFNIKGISINDPIIGDDTLHFETPVVPFVECWQNLFYFNDTFMQQIRARADQCNLTSYTKQYFKFPPPPGPFPRLPDASLDPNDTCDMWATVSNAAREVNPCFNVYHITDTCPSVFNIFGQEGDNDYVQPGTVFYFNRTDVQTALHAVPGTNWLECTNHNVFNYGYLNNYTLYDASPGPALDGTLQRVIERLNNTLIGVGNLDYLLQTNGTLFAMQNLTWNGMQGFQKYPQQNQFYVPYHPEYNPGRLSEAGYVGKWGEERGVVFYTVQRSGHELPGNVAGAGYRVLEKLLGRIGSLADVGDFTTQTGNFTGKGTIF